jgi:hypothetical protein
MKAGGKSRFDGALKSRLNRRCLEGGIKDKSEKYYFYDHLQI